MTYFRQLPNIQYQNFLNDRTGSQDYLLMKMTEISHFLRYKFTKRCFKSFDRPHLLLEQHLYLFYMLILCINQSNHLSFYGKSRNTLT